MECKDQMINSVKFFSLQKIIFKLLSNIRYGQLTISDATGIYVFSGNNGLATHAVNIQVNDLITYKKILLNGSLAAGETFMQGYWEVDDLTKFIEVIIKNTDIFLKVDSAIPKFINSLLRFSELFRKNNIKRNKKNILAHYDLGNEFFQKFLDPSMMYSCALYERDDSSLTDAAVKKIDTICQQLHLNPSDHLLEIGTGWGGFAIHAAKNYGCKITTTTISDKQYIYVKEQIKKLKLTDKVELLNKDYRQLNGQYDKLVSIEMIEAIGYKYFDTFFRQCNALLKPNGLFFLQAILINDQAYPQARKEIDFIKKYIFPGGCLPSMGAISQSVAKHTLFQLISFRDIGQHYAKTLTDWLENFNEHADEIRKQNFSEQFIRMWRYYLCYCTAAFRQNYITDVHAVWRKRE